MKKESLYEAGTALMLLAAVYPVFLLNAYAGTGVLLVGGALAGNRCGIHGSLRRFALGIFFSLALTAVWSTAFWRDPRELGTAYQIAVLESWMFICMEEEITPQLKLHLITLAALAAWSIYLAYFNTALLLKRRRALFGLLLSAELVFVGMWAASAYTPVALLYSYPNYGPLNSKVVPAAVAALLFLWAIRNLRHPERRSWRNVAWCAGGFAVFSLVAWTISATAMFVYSGRLLERTEYLADRRPTAPKDLYREMADLEARLPPPKGISLPVIGADFWHPQNGGEVVSDEIKKRTLKFAGSAAGEEYFALAKRYFELCQRSVGEYRYTDAGQRSEALINCIFAIRLIEMTAALAHYRGDAEQVLPLLDQLKKLEQAVYSHGDILGQLNGEIISGDRLRFIVACGPDRPEYAPHYRVLLKDCRKNCFRPRANGEAREELENIRRFRPAKILRHSAFDQKRVCHRREKAVFQNVRV